MLKKIPQKLLLLPLFFSLLLFSSSAIAVCSLVLGENIVVKSLSSDGFAALSFAARAVAAAAGQVPEGDVIAVACNSDREFIFAENAYQCVTSKTGKVWLDRNLGANKVCTARTDTQCYGDLYQWGRNTDGHEKINSDTSTAKITYTTTDNADFITSDDDWALGDNDLALRYKRWAMLGGSGVCPIGFRVPSATELAAERDSWGANNRDSAFASALKWANAGRRIKDGSFIGVGKNGNIWSNSIDGSSAPYLFFGNNNALIKIEPKSVEGRSVRCIQGPLPAAPSTITATVYGANTVTVEWNAIAFDVNFYEVYRATTTETATAAIIISPSINAHTSYTDTDLSAGTKYYYWIKACTTADNCSDFSASVSATTEDSVVDIASACAEDKAFVFAGKGYRCVAGAGDSVWLDRNLGAHRICTASDDAGCFGDYYQWGRNKDGHEKIDSSRYSTQIAYDTTDNPSFIFKLDGDWASDDYDGLERYKRWTALNGSGVCPIGFRVPSATELDNERRSWSDNNITGAFASPLKWPAAGFRTHKRDLDLNGIGYVWSNYTYTPDDDYYSSTYYLFFNNNNSRVDPSRYRVYGRPIRCIQGALPAPTAPSTITATVYGTNTITVEWNAIAFDVKFYEVYHSTAATTTSAVKIASLSSENNTNTPSANNIWTDTNLDAGTKYYYWIRACDTAGICSDFSNSVSATTKDSAVDIASACANGEAFAFAGNGYKCVTNTATATVWLDRNLGAHRVCTANNDGNCFGDRYQWGRNKDGHQRSNSGFSTMTITIATTNNADFIFTSTDINGTTDWASDDSDGLLRQKRWADLGGSSICPRGFRVPSASELLAAIAELSPPMNLESNTSLWSNDIYDIDNSKSLLLKYSFFEDNFITSSTNRTRSYPVRCIQD